VLTEKEFGAIICYTPLGSIDESMLKIHGLG
jgi:hypothetical protein